MTHLYKATEWGKDNTWYVADVAEIGATTANLWWTPARILNISPAEFAALLKNTFNAKHIKYYPPSKDYQHLLVFTFATQAEARKYKNYINKKARERNYICGDLAKNCNE